MFSVLMAAVSIGASALLIRSYIKKKRKGDRNLAIVLLVLTAILMFSMITTRMT
ncbi:hypothetical protein LJC56_12025 [Christensenellaceae bacterium OttesenSCG-928-K19]|nr:hypothetical protein [Christensenellaceae bacterium OttesenSCG-928-K19]